MTILIHGTDKFCYHHGNFQNAEAATGGVLKYVTKFTGISMPESFFNKVAGLRPATLLKR